MRAGTPALRLLLATRVKRGKEDPARLNERMGVAGHARPDGPLVWFHAASVGEAQSTLILITALLDAHPDLNILVTTGTVTSAELMKNRLPPRAIHQFYPLDHPIWVERFVDHWQPDLVLWMESELWPNMLGTIRARNIPAVLVNARLSPRSMRRWKRMRSVITPMLSTFTTILTQTDEHAANYRALGATHVITTDNLKFASLPLPYNATDLHALKDAIGARPVWLYASTHDGEEGLACTLHRKLFIDFPELLTIIVPRHPERRAVIATTVQAEHLRVCMRGPNKALPSMDDDIYVADTLGELGLFYRLAPISCIGRSFSRDGGGGHNPVEAAQLGSAVLYGPMVQNQQALYDEMRDYGAAIALADPDMFAETLRDLMRNQGRLIEQQNRGQNFAREKNAVLDRVMAAITPLVPTPKKSDAA